MQTQRAIMLAGFYLFVAISYLRSATLHQRSLTDLALAVCIAVTASLACVADSKIIRREMPHAAKWVMLFVWPIAIPIYLLWSRGLRGFVPLLVHTFILVVLWLGINLLIFSVQQH